MSPRPEEGAYKLLPDGTGKKVGVAGREAVVGVEVAAALKLLAERRD